MIIFSGCRVPYPRSGHCCVTDDRNLYVFGGYHPEYQVPVDHPDPDIDENMVIFNEVFQEVNLFSKRGGRIFWQEMYLWPDLTWPKSSTPGQYCVNPVIHTHVMLYQVVPLLESIQGICKHLTYRFEDTIVCERWHFWRSEINIDYRLIQCIRGFCSSPLPIFKLTLQVRWIGSSRVILVKRASRST